MADQLIINSKIGISKSPESALSTIKKLAADFQGAETNALNVQIPNVGKILNAGLIGRADEWATRAEPDYAEHTGITFSDRVNTGTLAVLAARTLSGDITDTLVEAGAYDHVVEMKASDLDPQLKSSSIAFKHGALGLILGGMVGNNFGLTLQGGAAPTYSVEMIGTGYSENMADQSPALVIPAAVAQDYVGQQARSSFEFNDGTVFDVGAAGRLDAFNLNYSNNVITGERRIGDPLVDSVNDNSGAYVRYLTRGDQRTLALSIGIYTSGSDIRGYLAHLENTEITNLKYKATGRIIGATTSRHEVEVIVPKAIISSVSLGGDRKGMLTLNFEPLIASGEDGLFKLRFRNGTATLT